MKTKFIHSLVIAGAAAVLSGCGSSSSSPEAKTDSAAPPPQSATQPGTPPVAKEMAQPAAAVPAAPATPATPAAPAAPAAAAPAQTADASSAVSQLTALAKAQSDPVLNSIGTELAQKMDALRQSAPADSNVKSQLDSSVQALAAGKDSSALTSAYQASQSASLTPQQTQLAKEVGNLASAFVVQRNFSSLDGAQGDVATIVNSLRKGEIAAAAPAVQKVAQNASLTSPQKELITSIANQYAPGLTKTAGTLQQGLDSLKGLGK